MILIFHHYRINRTLVVIAISAVILVVLLLNFLEYSTQGIVRFRTERASLRNAANGISDYQATNQETFDLTQRIEDLKRIKLSVRNELRLIEREKQKLLKEKSSLTSRNDKINAQIARSKAQLRQLELDISANRRQKFEKSCDNSRITPIVFNPLKSIGLDSEISLNDETKYDTIEIRTKDHIEYAPNSKSIEYKFDLSLCPLTKEFKFYVNFDLGPTATNLDDWVIHPSVIKDLLESHRQSTSQMSDACLVIHILDLTANFTSLNTSRNNLVIGANYKFGHDKTVNLMSENSAIALMELNNATYFRSKFDVTIPSIWKSPDIYESLIGAMPPRSPIDRKYLASYFGRESITSHRMSKYEEILQTLHRNSFEDLFSFVYNCESDSDESCNRDRSNIVENSIFLIIINSVNELDATNGELLNLALSKGTIPVILFNKQYRLPFDEVIDWRRASIILPIARLPELHFILKSIGPADLYQMKHFGRRIFEQHLATSKQILNTVISMMSLERFNYPPPPVIDQKTVAHNSQYELNLDTNCTTSTCSDSKTDSINSIIQSEMLGPREKPFASAAYVRNLSLTLSSTYDLWNSPIHSPFEMFPQHPQDPSTPSEFKFYSPDQGYRPINNGLGGSGLEFSRSLGGDYPNEQFTIVILTYQRQALLMKLLERLKGLAYLNKVIVVWNDIMRKPSEDLIWPDIGVPIVLVKVEKNSLNNRFIPYDAIETEAVFSMDDDSPLRADEIVLAFRVWRQSRDRIVGFPGRFHAWDNELGSWMYNSNHSCELSMVLTGGAFFHKYYTYLYTYNMPEAVRSIVDRFMNCEDIAMNFLVAHLTRKPPIKVTSRWTFHCAGCTSSLSEDDSHFKERHECLNTFASIYGYMPLLTTQHRSDSILFKTRLPQNKQKCFKFV